MYLQSFQWPRGYASASKLCSKHGHMPTGSASEYISAAPVLARFLVGKVGTPGFDERISSCLALCSVLELLVMSNSGHVTPEMLADAIGKHLSLQQHALGTKVWIPKSHWVTHLPGQMLRHKCLVSTFLMERKHRVLKRFADHRKNTQAYERGLMEEATLAHLHDADSPFGNVD